jgi:hypothetical protein
MVWSGLSPALPALGPDGRSQQADILDANAALDEKRWIALVESSSDQDVYYLPEYARASAEIEHTKPLALIAGSSQGWTLAPLLVRRISAGSGDSALEWLDAGTPYGYGGLLNAPGCVCQETIASFFHQLHAWCASRKIICCVLRLHPLLDQQNWIDRAGAWQKRLLVHPRGPTYSIRLSEWDENLNQPSSLRRDRKADMRLASRNLHAIQGTGIDEDIDAKLRVFKALYRPMMDGKKAEQFHRFPDSYFEKLAKLGKRFGIVIAMHGTEPAGANLFLFGSRYAHGHLAATSEVGRKYGTATYLNVEGARWSRQLGSELLHLGGGLKPGDLLEEFKRSFGGPSHTYGYVTFVVDPERFKLIRRLPDAPWPYHLASPADEAGSGKTV